MIGALARWLDRLRGRAGAGGSAALGRRAESLAASQLRRQRYRILARNLRVRFGEVDLLAEAPDGRTVVIIEVKALTGSGRNARGGPLGAMPETPEMHVDMRKQRKIAAVAVHVLRRHRLTNRPVRFDVVAIELAPGGEPVVRHHQGAFESPW